MSHPGTFHLTSGSAILNIRCPDTLWGAVQRCWSASPTERPTFDQIQQFF